MSDELLSLAYLFGGVVVGTVAGNVFMLALAKRRAARDARLSQEVQR